MESFLETRRSALLRLVFGFQRGVSYALLFSLIVLVLLQVYTRYVLNSPLTWTEELSRFANVLLTFIAASYVSAERKHLRVVLGANRFGRVAEALFEWFALLAVIVVGSVMVWGSYLSASASQINAPASGIPMSYLYLGVMLGYALMVLHAVLEGWDRVSGKAETAPAAEARGALL